LELSVKSSKETLNTADEVNELSKTSSDLFKSCILMVNGVLGVLNENIKVFNRLIELANS